MRTDTEREDLVQDSGETLGDWVWALVERSGIRRDLPPLLALALGSLLVALAVNALRPQPLPLTLSEVGVPGITAEHWAELQFVEAEEAARLVAPAGSGLLVDGRAEGDFVEIHARGARPLPYRGFVTGFPQFEAEVARDQPIIVYGQGPPADHGLRVAVRLLKAGYRDVRVLPGGIADWVEGGLPVEGQP